MVEKREEFELEITKPNEAPRYHVVDQGAYTIGSSGGNKVRLTGEGVAPRHAVLTLMADECYVEELLSETGVFIEGRKIETRRRVFPHQSIGIGVHTVRFKPTDTAVPEPPPPIPEAASPAPQPQPMFDDSQPGPGPVPDPAAVHASPPAQATARKAPPPHVEQRSEEAVSAERVIKRQLQSELLERLDIKRLTINQVQEDELRHRVKSTLDEIIDEVRERLPAHIDPAKLGKELYDEAVGLGPLEDLLKDPEISEIMVNGPGGIYVERAGKIERTSRTFIDDNSVLAVIERIVSPIGRRIDESTPYVDARLPDGSRVNAIIPPLSLSGPCLTIRIFSKEPLVDADLCRFGTLTPDLCSFIEATVKCRKNILISGGTGSGKTTLLNVVSNYLPETERIVTIEDAAELRLPQDHVIRLESRPPNIEGRGAITIRDLVRNALRMRPDRIVVGECRGGEALDMLQAMNTGHEGSLTTVHANSPRDAISRMETMVLMAGMELPLRAIREQIGSAIHLVVHLSRYSDGTRKVNRITEVVGLEGDTITMQDIFEYKQTGVKPDGALIGHFRPTGAVPTYLEEMRVRGVDIEQSIFDEAHWGMESGEGESV